MLSSASQVECCGRRSVDAVNRDCHCFSYDAQQRRTRVAAGGGDDRLMDLLGDRPNLFAGTAVFLSRVHYQQMASLVQEVARSTATESYLTAIQARDPDVDMMCQRQSRSVLMGFDFHITPDGPRLIEINTNAGAAFLARKIADTGSGCLASGAPSPGFAESGLDDALVSMFLEEWHSLRPGEQLRTLAIVDDDPESQYLYPDMLLAADLLNARGIRTIIADPSALDYRHGKLWHGDAMIDMVYNRLTDFRLEAANSLVLRKAYEGDAAVVSPSPRHHALFADKRNLQLFGGDEGSPGAVDAKVRAMIPLTRLVRAIDPETAWKARKSLFLKPTGGYGSRAAYRGAKLTRQVWQTILQGDYVAQDFVPASGRGLVLAGVPVQLRFDIRLYAYGGQPLFPVARMYSGQTTNFRTPGGGLAPVILV